mmetsp:Transcript_20583/g.43129  ORF Transcript_20583/g.43129 Transcript_20583/m.43129 type:complete len:763 (-) Transcript_20583:40-2328(-)
MSMTDPQSTQETKTCICPYGDRCRDLAQAFTQKSRDPSVRSRGGYIEIPPSHLDHLAPAPRLVFNYAADDQSLSSNESHGSPDESGTLGSTSSDDIAAAAAAALPHVVETRDDSMTAWQQIRKAYIHYFHLVAEERNGSSNGEQSQFQQQEDNDNSEPKPFHIALHHFHSRIISPMRKRQQAWDTTPVWQCLYAKSLNVLMKGEENMIMQMINQSNRLKIEGKDGQESENNSCPSYIVLPSFPIERSERDLDRLKRVGVPDNMSSGVTEESTPDCGEESPEMDAFAEPIPSPQNGLSLLSQSHHDKRGSKMEQHQLSDCYHKTLLTFEKMRRGAADERLAYVQSTWDPRYQTLKTLVKEFDRVYALMHSSWLALENYTKALVSLESSKPADGVFAGLVPGPDDADIIEPLVHAFSCVASDWQEDLPHLKSCCDDFRGFRNKMENAIQQIQETFIDLQHTAVKDEIEIRQAWSELEELCIIDSELEHRRGPIDDRWLRELAYRRLIVVEKTSIKSKLQPILNSVGELEKHCEERIHEVLLSFMPKHRRLFLRTRELFDPAIDTLEAGIIERDVIEQTVEKEATPVKEDDLSQPPPSTNGSFSFMSVLGSAKSPEAEKAKQDMELEADMTKLGSLLQSVHIYEVQIVSFRVEFDTWVTSFCVITHQQFMHFFPLLPGTDFEGLRKEAQPALASACVAAWEKGSTPLLSVRLTSCSYGVSPDGSFIELVIATPPRKKIGLRVGSPEECAEWVSKTQRWVMLFSMK